MTNLDKHYFSILPKVAKALERGMPVVALESTVITHGLPHPENVLLARALETEVRQNGCVPATIAILDGRICVGLDSAQIEQLVSTQDVVKVSARDIASTLVRGKSGGTTVAGTLAIAQEARIKVFATGGIGGVHRGAAFDVSADLVQLSRSQLVVVCAGAKAIMDIPSTLEVLETYGVPVIGYQTDEFPAFYSVSSGISVNHRVDSAEEAAAIAHMHWDLGMRGSILVAVPPPEDVALVRGFVESAIQAALDEAEEQHIHGQAVTPFLLSKVSELTAGKSLQVNVELLKNNARVAAQISKYMHS